VGGFLGTGAFTQQSLQADPVSTIVLIFAKTQLNINTLYKREQNWARIELPCTLAYGILVSALK
jgi:hypothetical protein